MRSQNIHSCVFKEYNDFAKVICHGRLYHFGLLQSKIIKQLYCASFSSSPWLFGQNMLENASAHSATIRDLFKSQKNWREIIESDNKGYYRLKIDKDIIKNIPHSC